MSKQLLHTSMAALMAASTMAPLAAALEFKDDDGGGNDAPEMKKFTDEVKSSIADLGRQHDEFKKTIDNQLAELKKTGKSDPLQEEKMKKLSTAMDAVEQKLKDIRLEQNRPSIDDGQGGRKELSEDEVKHAQAYDRFLRKGLEDFDGKSLAELEQKALATTGDPEGGYTAPEQFDRTILKAMKEDSPFRGISGQQTIGTNQLKKLRQIGGAGGGWVGETQARPETGTPTFADLLFNVMEVYANPAATQRFLDDSFINVDQWLAEEVSETFTDMEVEAFVNGDGNLKPKGFLNSAVYAQAEYDPAAEHVFGQLNFVKTGSATGWNAGTDPGDEQDTFLDLMGSLKSKYLPGSQFVMNRRTKYRVRKIKDADGRMIWNPDLTSGNEGQLLGHGITTMDVMPEFADGNTPIAFGDFRRGYLIVDRIGIRILRDPYTNKPYVHLYTTKRVGGGVYDSDAIKLLKVAA